MKPKLGVAARIFFFFNETVHPNKINCCLVRSMFVLPEEQPRGRSKNAVPCRRSHCHFGSTQRSQ